VEKQQEQYFVQYWLDKRHMLRTGGKNIVTKYPEADAVLNHVYNILENITSLARSTQSPVGNSAT
jgi:hypothetical protein